MSCSYFYLEMKEGKLKNSVVVLKNERIWCYYKTYLTICGLCINSDRNWKIYSSLISLLLFSGFVLLSYSVYYFMDEMESCAVVIHHSILLISSQIVTVYFMTKRNIHRLLVSGMSISYDYESELVNEFLREMQIKRLEDMKFAFKCVITVQAFTQVFLIMAALLDVYTRDVEFLLQFPCWFPFDLSYRPYHILAVAWEHTLIEVVCCTIFGVMAFIFLVYSHITTQFALLKFSIERSKDRAVELAMKSATNKKLFLSVMDTSPKLLLKESYIIGMRMCAEHHSQIIDYYNKAFVIFRVIYFLLFVSGLVIFTCSGFALISDNKPLKIKFSVVSMIQLVFLYVVCWFGEQVAERSEDVRLAVYESAWDEMPKQCISTLRLMVERTMKPLGFTTLTGQKVNLDNYMSMIRASYSYFNMMMASQDKQ